MSRFGSTSVDAHVLSNLSTLRALVAIAICALTSTVARAQSDTTASMRGVVTDSAGRGISNVDIDIISSGRRTTTDAAGRFSSSKLSRGATVIRLRRLGWEPKDTSVVLSAGHVTVLAFVLRRLQTALDTIRVLTQDDCAPRAFAGFACRQRVGRGQYLDAAAIAALKPETKADLLEGLHGLRREGHGVVPTTGWRCLIELYNGHPPMSLDYRTPVKDIVAVEFYDVNANIPVWYKNFAYLGGKYPLRCTLLVYWTR